MSNEFLKTPNELRVPARSGIGNDAKHRHENNAFGKGNREGYYTEVVRSDPIAYGQDDSKVGDINRP